MNDINLDYTQILELIPHRLPFLLIDKIESLIPDVSVIGIKSVTATEPHFAGHFPNYPVMPGVLIVEAMAQTAGIVVSETLSNNKDQSVLFMSISKAKFRKPVLPNYKIKFFVEMTNNVKNVYKFLGKAFHNDSLVSESEFSAMITSK